jgi:hypothetical protein
MAFHNLNGKANGGLDEFEGNYNYFIDNIAVIGSADLLEIIIIITLNHCRQLLRIPETNVQIRIN